jgi:hypothetical protein
MLTAPIPATAHALKNSRMSFDAFDLVEIKETAEPYPAHFLWADPTIGSLRSAMRRVFEDRPAARLLGAAGRSFASEMFSVRETAGCIKREIERIWSDGGAPDRQSQS